MSDDEIRSRYADLPALDFPDAAFTRPPPLAEARVALVTTAGLRDDGQSTWLEDPTGFTIVGPVSGRSTLTHHSANFDRIGFGVDPNVVFPVDRLAELAAQGTIGSVADRHISFLGAQPEAGLEAIRLDSGPAAAAVLAADDVDVVVLTPVCPACTRTVCTLAHVLEAAGMTTLAIASIRGQAVRARPPRALAVDFPLGRPLGIPGDPAFQHRVLSAAIALIAVESGPVLVDFDERVEADSEPVACTIPPVHDPDLSDVVSELRALRPAYDRRQEAVGGRTAVGRLGGGADVLEQAILGFERIVGGTSLDAADLPAGHPRDAALDLRSYYEEAALALTEHVPAARATDTWFIRTTRCGALLADAQRVLRAAGAPRDTWLHLLPIDAAEHDDR